jgi:hypothetical protein
MKKYLDFYEETFRPLSERSIQFSFRRMRTNIYLESYHFMKKYLDFYEKAFRPLSERSIQFSFRRMRSNHQFITRLQRQLC